MNLRNNMKSMDKWKDHHHHRGRVIYFDSYLNFVARNRTGSANFLHARPFCTVNTNGHSSICVLSGLLH
jgi:hypothetical protein